MARTQLVCLEALHCEAHDEVETLQLPPQVLARFGWERLIATTELNLHEFGDLLASLRRESCAHSWAYQSDTSSSPADTAAEILRRETRHRPTTVVAYRAYRTDGRSDLVAVGSVAARINRDFPYGGFPVVARCYINPLFRGAGLYRRLLAHRIGLCHAYWNTSLKAVHVGTASPAVLRTATSGATGYRFVPVGEEHLAAGPQRHRVNVLLWFTPEYAACLRTELATYPDDRLRELVHGLLFSGWARDGFARFTSTIAKMGRITGKPLSRDLPQLAELHALLNAIPVSMED